MAQDMHYKVPIFDGTIFLYWDERMKSHLQKLQNRIQTRYTEPQGGAKTLDEIKLKEANAKARAIIFSCIHDSVFGGVKGLKETKVVFSK